MMSEMEHEQQRHISLQQCKTFEETLSVVRMSMTLLLKTMGYYLREMNFWEATSV